MAGRLVPVAVTQPGEQLPGSMVTVLPSPQSCLLKYEKIPWFKLGNSIGMWRKEKSQLLLTGPFQHSAAETAHLRRSQAGDSVLVSALHPSTHPRAAVMLTQITEETGGHLPDLNDHCIFWEVFHTLKEKTIKKKIHHNDKAKDKAVDFLGISFLENTVQCSSSLW